MKMRQSYVRFGLGSYLALALGFSWTAACDSSSPSSSKADCDVGEIGCECAEEEPRCASGTCMAGVCVEASCVAEAEGCPCAADGACDTGLTCLRNRCVPDLPPPEDPQCFTPCLSDLVELGLERRACSSDGLMEGCLDGRECVEGSCVAEDEAPQECGAHRECPDFQRCMRGQCYSDCERDDECVKGEVCVRHACRLGCKTEDADSCDKGYFCDAPDGVVGSCQPMPAAESTDDEPALIPGSFELSVEALRFDNLNPGATFTITNTSSEDKQFTVAKRSETRFGTDGAAKTFTNDALPWVMLGAAEDAKRQTDYMVLVEGHGGTAEVSVDVSGEDLPLRWAGELEVRAAGVSSRTLPILYSGRPDGRWVGEQVYLADFGINELDAWVAAGKPDGALLQQVGNALVQRWAAFKFGRLTFDEFRAALLAVSTESWANDTTKARCDEAGNRNGACYLFDNPAGILTFTADSGAAPVPAAPTTLPFAINAIAGEDESSWTGRVDSSATLHYGGDPYLQLQFEGDPSECQTEFNDACVTRLQSLRSRVAVGGRYNPPAGTCAPGYGTVTIPVLGDGDASTRYECRSSDYPFGAARKAENENLAGANPIPDGLPRVRTLEVLDGAIINQQFIIALFRERFALGVADADITGYGYLFLRRESAELSEQDFVGTVPPISEAEPLAIEATCDARLRNVLPDATAPLTDASATVLAQAALFGTGFQSSPIAEGGTETTHYLCEYVGCAFDELCEAPMTPGCELCQRRSFFDTGYAGVRQSCPEGSQVRFFTLTDPDPDGSVLEDFAADAADCETAGDCGPTLEKWRQGGLGAIRMAPSYCCGTGTDPMYCANVPSATCDHQRDDLRIGKTFLQRSNAQTPTLQPLREVIREAFAFRSTFVSTREQDRIGLLPRTCDESAYCYDPERVLEIASRVDCALTISQRHALPQLEAGWLFAYLRENFSFESTGPAGSATAVRTSDGFETLFAELTIMFADDALAKAYGARFDLAESKSVTFDGAAFEPGAPKLSGVAGMELYSLYRAVDYYRRVVDRFHGQSSALWTDLLSDRPEPRLLSHESVTSYLSKLVEGSSKKARAYAEIARRYQALGQTEVARRLLTREYQATYLEGVLIANLMRTLADRLGQESRTQATIELRRGQRVFAMALQEMKTTFATLTDEARVFDLPPDFVPFPPNDVAGGPVRYQLSVAREDLDRAIGSEDVAISDARELKLAEVDFQAQLRELVDGYDGQLAELCGSFMGTDGQRHPASTEYAGLIRNVRLPLPCGLVGNGAIYEALLEVDNRRDGMKAAVEGYDRVIAELQILGEDLQARCDLAEDEKAEQVELDGEINSLEDVIAATEMGVRMGRRIIDLTGKISALAKCGGTDCAAGAALSGVLGAVEAVQIVAEGVADGAVNDLENQVRALRQGDVIARIERQCDYAQVNYETAVKTKLLDLGDVSIQIAIRQREVMQALSAVEGLRTKAERLEKTKAQRGQELTDLAAAKWDPNVRVYQTNAMLAAEADFDRAIKAAFKATRAYEYHYAQATYAEKEALFLIRTADKEPLSLQSYLDDLADATDAKEQEFASPNRDVLVLSLLDDVLDIPRQATDGRSLAITERVELMRRELVSGRFIDNDGALRIPFRTRATDVSDRTWGHRIDAVEAELIGSDLGDASADLSLIPRGTSVVKTAQGASGLVPELYYSFPDAEAKLDPVFNGVRNFEGDQSVYRSERLRFRPVINTEWDLVLDQRSNRFNQDINLESLSDMRLYIYFDEFTGVER